MGSFTQGGIALGQSLGGGIENYVAGRERRELLVGKALGIQKQLRDSDKRSDEDNKYLKKFDDVNEMGTRQLQSLISEFETGEELQMMGMKRKLLQYQVEAAQAGSQSKQGLAQFGQDLPGVEAGFEGDAHAYPEYLSRDYLEGDRGQRDIAAGAFPGEHYGDESKAVYEDVRTEPVNIGPYAGEEAINSDFTWRGESPDVNVPDSTLIDDQRNSSGFDLSGIPSRQIDHLKGAALFGNRRKTYAKRDSLVKSIKSLEGYFDRNPGFRPSEGNQDHGSVRDYASKKRELKDLIEKNPWLAPSKEEPLEAYNIPIPASAPEIGQDYVTAPPTPQGFEKRLAGYETYGAGDTTTITEPALDEDGNDTGETRSRTYAGADPHRPLDRYAVTGGTPDTPVDERRGQLIDSLAQYNLTPTDRKQAIDMISEKYPKLKEIATGVESPDGKALGFTIGNTFIPARQSVGGAGAGTEGLELTSITVNDKGEVTRILKPKEDLEKGQKVLLANSKEFKHQAKKLLEVVDSHGNWESAFSAFFSDSSATAKAELDSLAFRMAILYSKIVDPDTAAREGEVVAAKKYAFQMGFFTPNGVTKASVNSMLAEVMRRESSLYEQEGIDAPQAKGAGAATNPADQLGIMK